MNYIQEVIHELYKYEPKLTKQADFDNFWDERLISSKRNNLDSTKIKKDYPSNTIDLFEITYKGFDNTIISGMLIIPKTSGGNKIPCLINFHGFTWYRGVPSDFAQYTSMGVAVLSIDIRGQGGLTRDRAEYDSGMANNLLVDGILSPEDCYYGRVYIDCVRAVDFALSIENIDPEKIIIHGSSQGGGLGMAVAALDNRPWLTLVDCPSNSNIVRRVEKGAGAFILIQDYIKRNPEQYDNVFNTLSYIDTMNMAERITCPVFASVGLNDNICPPEQYMATFNRIKSKKEIVFYPHRGHEGGGELHTEAKIKFIYDRLYEAGSNMTSHLSNLVC